MVHSIIMCSCFMFCSIGGDIEISNEMLKQKELFTIIFAHFLMWIDTTATEVPACIHPA